MAGFPTTPALLSPEPASNSNGQCALFRNAVILVSLGVQDPQKKMKMFY